MSVHLLSIRRFWFTFLIVITNFALSAWSIKVLRFVVIVEWRFFSFVIRGVSKRTSCYSIIVIKSFCESLVKSPWGDSYFPCSECWLLLVISVWSDELFRFSWVEKCFIDLLVRWSIVLILSLLPIELSFPLGKDKIFI